MNFRFLAFSFLGCLAACGEPGPATDVIVRDSAGVEVVVSGRPAWSGEAAPWTIDPVPALELSSDPNVPDQTLFAVADAKLLTDGRVVVANAGSAQLLVFDSTGSFAAAWGGPGDGPGEFSRLLGVSRCGRGDTLIVQEPGRLSVLDATGILSRTESVVGRLTTSGTYALEGVSRDCSSVLLAVRHPRAPSGPGERVFQYPTEVYWAPLDGRPPVPIDSFPGNEVMTVDVGGRLVGARFAFGVEPVWATDGQRVFYGPADRSEIHVFGADGQLDRVLRWGAPREAISDDEWAQYDEWRQAMIQEDPAGSSGIL